MNDSHIEWISSRGPATYVEANDRTGGGVMLSTWLRRTCGVAGVAAALAATTAAASPSHKEAPTPPASKYGYVSFGSAKEGFVSLAGRTPTGTYHEGYISNKMLKEHPEMRSLIPSSATAGVEPDSSQLHRLDQVCGKVTGTNLKITEVYTTATTETDVGCIHPHYVIVLGTDYADGTVIRSATGAPAICTTPGGGVSYYYFNNNVPDKMPYTCPSTSELGVFWDRVAGDPRFKIYKSS